MNRRRIHKRGDMEGCGLSHEVGHSYFKRVSRGLDLTWQTVPVNLIASAGLVDPKQRSALECAVSEREMVLFRESTNWQSSHYCANQIGLADCPIHSASDNPYEQFGRKLP
jgi:hypothetical protein